MPVLYTTDRTASRNLDLVRETLEDLEEATRHQSVLGLRSFSTPQGCERVLERLFSQRRLVTVCLVHWCEENHSLVARTLLSFPCRSLSKARYGRVSSRCSAYSHVG